MIGKPNTILDFFKRKNAQNSNANVGDIFNLYIFFIHALTPYHYFYIFVIYASTAWPWPKYFLPPSLPPISHRHISTKHQKWKHQIPSYFLHEFTKFLLSVQDNWTHCSLSSAERHRQLGTHLSATQPKQISY
jgi:hypothetical protein